MLFYTHTRAHTHECAHTPMSVYIPFRENGGGCSGSVVHIGHCSCSHATQIHGTVDTSEPCLPCASLSAKKVPKTYNS